MTSRSLLSTLLKPTVYLCTIAIAVTLCQSAQAQQIQHLEAARRAVDVGLAQYRSTRSRSVLLSTIYTSRLLLTSVNSHLRILLLLDGNWFNRGLRSLLKRSVLTIRALTSGSCKHSPKLFDTAA